LTDQFTDRCTGCGGVARSEVLGESHCGEDADHGNHDHQLHKGETLLEGVFLFAELLEELKLHAMLQS